MCFNSYPSYALEEFFIDNIEWGSCCRSNHCKLYKNSDRVTLILITRGWRGGCVFLHYSRVILERSEKNIKFLEMAGGSFGPAGVAKERAAQYQGRLTIYVIIACTVAAVGGSIFGYDIGISGTSISWIHSFSRFTTSVETLANDIREIVVERNFWCLPILNQNVNSEKFSCPKKFVWVGMWKKSSSHAANWYNSVQIIKPPYY